MRHLAFGITGLITVLSGALAAGCGDTSPDTTKYEGTWTYTSGTVGGTCAGMTAMRDLTNDTATLAKGTSSDLVLTLSPTCVIAFNMKGAQAVAAPAQTCTIEVPMVGSLVITVDSWTLDTADGVTMTGALMGKTTIPVGAFMITCDVNGSGSLMKQ